MQISLSQAFYDCNAFRVLALSFALIAQPLGAFEKEEIAAKGNLVQQNSEIKQEKRVSIKTNLGEIEVCLFEEDAPKTCENFCAHIEQGTYSDASFYRVISGFVIQGGIEPGGVNTKGKNIVPVRNESTPKRKNVRGTIAMARTNNIDSATTEFFINLVDNPHLDATNHENHNGYTVFGDVTKGMHVVDAIAASKTSRSDRPIVAVKIESIELVSST